MKDLESVKRFYRDVIGLEVLREFDGVAFLTIGEGYGGHTQIIGLFQESLPAPGNTLREPVRVEGTSLHHFAMEIDKSDYRAELERLSRLGVELTTYEHLWCHWRSIYVKDPEGNVVELVCYDESVG